MGYRYQFENFLLYLVFKISIVSDKVPENHPPLIRFIKNFLEKKDKYSFS